MDPVRGFSADTLLSRHQAGMLRKPTNEGSDLVNQDCRKQRRAHARQRPSPG